MKVPYSWLKEFVPTRLGPEQVAEKITAAGFEVEGIETIGREPVLEIAVTPNRGDALSILGIAREVAALTGVPLKKVGAPLGAPKKNKTLPLQIRILSKSDCPRYACALVTSVRVGPSPSWLVDRLTQVGLRSINNIVDATNFVLMERGQPLHAFDYEKIKGRQIIVRKAKAGEKLETLDGVTRSLVAEDLLIADAEGGIALAGVMGGQDSAVSESTQTIVLESAVFHPATVRRTSRRLGLLTDSSYRFERGVDEEGILPALARVIEVIGMGELVQVIDVRVGAGLKPARTKKVIVSSSAGEINQLLGTSFKEMEMKKILVSLGFQVRGAKKWKVTAPSYRSDISHSSDLAEEVARLKGYAAIPSTLPPIKPQRRSTLSCEKKAKQFLTCRGFTESASFSFVSPEEVRRVDPSLLERGISLANPISQDLSLMRPLLIPSLLKGVVTNQNHQTEELRLFESAHVYWREGEKIIEKRSLAGVLVGDKEDFLETKGIVQALLKELGIRRGDSPHEVRYERATRPFLHPGKSAELRVGGTTIGFVGTLHPEVAATWGIRREPAIFELDLEFMSGRQGEPKRFQELPRFPWVERDICLVVDRGLEAEKVESELRLEPLPIDSVKLFDLYEGGQVPAGKKSLAYHIRYQRRDRTLTDDEVSGYHQKIISHVRQKLGAEIR
ncbi:MAG: phenylalanine--tRNA ligase subunit beta [Deltaproteobacteria bacterium]|nr:phenylalanine--tRNA ligase subunit beta [Deltaproteobacteria bacterium]